MAIMVGVLSQKGGVGKSMVSRLLASEYTRIKWRALIADMDISQKTSFEWSERRKNFGIEPYVDAKYFNTVEEVLTLKEDYDIIIFDGAPHSSRITKQIAQNCDLIVLPTGSSLDDLNPQIRLAHELIRSSINKDKILFVLSRIGNSLVELQEVVNYIGQTDYKLLDDFIPEKTVFRQAIREGKTLTETRYKGLTKKCEKVAQGIANQLTALVN